SFGIDARMVAEHCLAAEALRDERDRRLTTVTMLCGVLFLPGMLLWLLAFQGRAQVKKALSKTNPSREGFYDTMLLVLVGVAAVVVAVRPAVTGLWVLYFRAMVAMPVLGWYLARRIALRSTVDLRARWLALVEGNAIAATVPKAVPRDDLDKKANALR